MIETINGKAYFKVGDKVYEVGGGGIDVASAKVGQTIKVKAVDENGKPTEWESADFPESGVANIITAESEDALPDPATVPEGTVALVSSEGESGGGLPVVTTTITPAQSGAGPDVNGYLTTDENALVDAIGANPFLLCFPMTYGGMPVKMTVLLTPITAEYEGTTAVMWYGGTVTFEQGIITITLRQDDFGVYNLFYYDVG